MKIPIAEITVNWLENSRGALQPEQVTVIADSLEKNGLINPVTVQKQEDGSVKLVAGYTWFAAAKQLGWTEIEVFFKEGDSTSLNFTENIMRSQPSMYQEALALQKWRTDDGVGYREIAKKLGVSMNWIMARLRLLELDEETKRLADGPKGSITAKEIHKRFNAKFSNNYIVEKKTAKVDVIPQRPPEKKEKRVRLNSEIQDVARQLVDRGEFGPVLTTLNWICGAASNTELREVLNVNVN